MARSKVRAAGTHDAPPQLAPGGCGATWSWRCFHLRGDRPASAPSWYGCLLGAAHDGLHEVELDGARVRVSIKVHRPMGRPRTLDPVEVARLLEQEGGNRSAVARLLEVTEGAIRAATKKRID